MFFCGYEPSPAFVLTLEVGLGVMVAAATCWVVVRVGLDFYEWFRR